MEVLEEEEIAALKEQQRKFLELRAMEKAETRRLEEQERRLREEKVRDWNEKVWSPVIFSKYIQKKYFDRINDWNNTKTRWSLKGKRKNELQQLPC